VSCVSRSKKGPRSADAQDPLKPENVRLRRELAERDRQLAEAEKRITEAKKKIADLEHQLALRQQNSTTTSKPPPPMASPAVNASVVVAHEQSTQARWSTGTPGTLAAAGSADRVNAIVDLLPDTCRHCQHALQPRQNVGDPRRHQVTELPLIKAYITEYRCHQRVCPACGHTTQARCPTRASGSLAPN
jgi:transposase